MQIAVTSISLLFIIAIILYPIAILMALKKLKVKRFKLPAYFVLGLVITSTIIFSFAWWADASRKILLSHYGYDFDAEHDTETFSNVSPENLERVKSLQTSMMGIGWPLKAIITFTSYSPYLLIIYLVIYLIQKQINRTASDTEATF